MPYQIRMGLCVRQSSNGVTKYYFTHIGFAEFMKNQKVTFDYSMLRETLIKFGAKEDTFVYTDSRGDVKHFPCWSKVEDTDIEEAYEGAMEIEEGDRNSLNIESVGEASNVDEYEPKEEEKLYSDEDKAESEDLF